MACRDRLPSLPLCVCLSLCVTMELSLSVIIHCCGFCGGGVSGGQCLELQLGCLQNMQRAPALSSSSKSSFPTWALRILTDICIRVLTLLSSSKIMISNLGIWQSQPTFVKQGSNFVEQLKIIISIPVIADLN
jgi:hypothetical protein